MFYKEVIGGRNKKMLCAIAKLICESDSIGERYSYCDGYDMKSLREDAAEIKTANKLGAFVQNYLSVAIKIYDLTEKNFRTRPTVRREE